MNGEIDNMNLATNKLYEKGLDKYNKYKEDMKTSNAGMSIPYLNPRSRISSYYLR